MNSADGYSLQQLPGRGRVALVLLISGLFHLLIFWWLGSITLNEEANQRARQRALRLTLAPPSPATSLAEPTDQSVASAPQKQSVASNEETAPVYPQPEADSPPKTPATTPSAAVILATAREQARQMASEDRTETKPDKNHIESALENAFNPRKEPPGVKRLSDGTIRVVTDWGLVYCVRAADDVGILGPEDDMPLNKTCN